ncbi:MOSC domain-containing protein [Variovorax rhizosphaerae]|uniref:MOSC domain-containing protein n=1 Tax=Variovorax rhizosphaerae TaxID=1836200 RepID=A0ABU8WR89_9BURK
MTSTPKRRGSVIAVSASLPQWHDINGVLIYTSIVKVASPVPLHFGLSGPDGNGLALHSESTYAFAAEHYNYWADSFEVDRASWAPCQWGENLMIAGLHEDELKVGDLLHFSGGAVLEVTGARTPCHKLSWRLGLPGSVLKKLTRKGWLGWYMRVIESGCIGPGDVAEVNTAFPDNLSVGELGRLLDRGTSGEVIDLRRAAEMPKLSYQNKEQLLHTIDHVEDMQRERIGRWPGWREFRVTRRSEEAAGVVSLELVPKDGGAVAPFRAGQHVTVQLPGKDGQPIQRCWSLSDFSEVSETYRLTVKRVIDGLGSDAFHRLEAGSELRLKPPAGQFKIERSGLRPIVLISSGIGITPMLAILKSHFSGFAPTPVTWLHSTQSSKTHVFKRELDDFLNKKIGVRQQVHYTQALPGDVQGRDFHRAGRISKDDLRELVERPSRYLLAGKEIELSGRTQDFYVCGTAEFQSEIAEALKSLGVPAHLIRSESFDAAQAQGSEVVPSNFEVIYALSGIQAKWGIGPANLLDHAEACGVDTEFGCRNGSCGACSAYLEKGEVGYVHAPTAEVSDGRVLLCCSIPKTAAVTLRL